MNTAKQRISIRNMSSKAIPRLLVRDWVPFPQRTRAEVNSLAPKERGMGTGAASSGEPGVVKRTRRYSLEKIHVRRLLDHPTEDVVTEVRDGNMVEDIPGIVEWVGRLGAEESMELTLSWDEASLKTVETSRRTPPALTPAPPAPREGQRRPRRLRRGHGTN